MKIRITKDMKVHIKNSWLRWTVNVWDRENTMDAYDWWMKLLSELDLEEECKKTFIPKPPQPEECKHNRTIVNKLGELICNTCGKIPLGNYTTPGKVMDSLIPPKPPQLEDLKEIEEWNEEHYTIYIMKIRRKTNEMIRRINLLSKNK